MQNVLPALYINETKRIFKYLDNYYSNMHTPDYLMGFLYHFKCSLIFAIKLFKFTFDSKRTCSLQRVLIGNINLFLRVDPAIVVY